MAINNDGRLRNTTACLPIAYGSVAFYLGKECDEFSTHRWTLYVRSPDQSFDLSKAISKASVVWVCNGFLCVYNGPNFVIGFGLIVSFYNDT